MMTKSFKVLLLLSLFLFILPGCSHQDKNQDIVIGVAWPFESNNSLFREGVRLAVMQINAGGGVNGHKIRLIEKDDQASVSDGMTIAQSFADNNEIVAVIGHRNSFISIPASRVYQEAGLLMISPASTSPELTKNGYKNVFRSIPSDDKIVAQLVSYAARQGHRQMVIFYAEDSYGMDLANSFEDHAIENGITIVDRISYYGGLKELNRLKQKWLALGFDGVFVADSLPEGAEFIADARRVGISVPFMGGNAMDSPALYEIAGQSALGTVIGTVFNPHDPRDETQRFVKAFREQYKTMPGSYAAQGYDAVNLLAAAIEKSGSTDSAAIAKELHRLKNWPGVTGYHGFDNNGNDMAAKAVMKIQRENEFEYMK
ncbi:MAG: ABC transporter substrate-binding protein [Syntrophomonadaceae bacterium]|nr:ABC transporter substrate-binding protein [Syntrophomonadaceae bacterium]